MLIYFSRSATTTTTHARPHARMQNPFPPPSPRPVLLVTSMARERYRELRIDWSGGSRAAAWCTTHAWRAKTGHRPRSNYHDRTFTLDFREKPVAALFIKSKASTKRPGIIGNFDPFVKRAPTSFDRVTASYFCKRACIVNLGEFHTRDIFFFFSSFFFFFFFTSFQGVEGAGGNIEAGDWNNRLEICGSKRGCNDFIVLLFSKRVIARMNFPLSKVGKINNNDSIDLESAI